MSDPLRLAVITASVRRDRIGPVVARWFLGELPAHTDAVVDGIDLADLDLPADLGGGADAGEFTDRLAQLTWWARTLRTAKALDPYP